jgi:hypothetical protein
MALPPLAEFEDFETWCSRAVPNESRAEAILSAASTLVRTSTGRMWVDAAGDPEEDLTETQLDAAKTVVLQVSERVYFNPNGNTQESTGPFQRSVAAWYALGLVLTDEERQMLGPTETISGLGVISTTRGQLETPSVSACRTVPEWE